MNSRTANTCDGKSWMVKMGSKSERGEPAGKTLRFAVHVMVICSCKRSSRELAIYGSIVTVALRRHDAERVGVEELKRGRQSSKQERTK